MSTSPSTLEDALGRVPPHFKDRLLEGYRMLKSAYTDRQFDACGIRAGKVSETLLRYLQHELTGTFTPFGTKIKNLTDECIKLEKLPTTAGHESFRVLIPRALNFAYTLRNKRDIGHVGGEVDANEIDAAAAVRLMDWCLSEIIRVTLAVPLEDAQAILDAIAEREIPVVWAVPGGRKRVLDATLSQADQALVLLYGDIDTAIPVEDLADWVGTKRPDLFKTRVVNRLHERRLVEFDDETRTVILSPTGKVAAEVILQRMQKAT
jgi:hypothetical protein